MGRPRETEEMRLLRVLRSRMLTQRKVASRLGVTDALVSMWANGKRKPGQARIVALRQLVADTRSESTRLVR
jgi:predicted transcriptional regulator